jgi:hypothetical protein
MGVCGVAVDGMTALIFRSSCRIGRLTRAIYWQSRNIVAFEHRIASALDFWFQTSKVSITKRDLVRRGAFSDESLDDLRA